MSLRDRIVLGGRGLFVVLDHDEVRGRLHLIALEGQRDERDVALHSVRVIERPTTDHKLAAWAKLHYARKKKQR